MKVPHKIWILVLGIAVALLVILTTLVIPDNASKGAGSHLEPQAKPTSFEQVGKTLVEKVIGSAGFRTLTRK